MVNRDRDDQNTVHVVHSLSPQLMGTTQYIITLLAKLVNNRGDVITSDDKRRMVASLYKLQRLTAKVRALDEGS